MKGILMMAKPDASSADGGGSCDNCVLVPRAALLIDSAAPGVGDSVDFEASGKVLRMQGEDFVVEITSANDKPIEAGGDGDEEPGEDPGAARDAAKDSYLNGGNDNGN